MKIVQIGVGGFGASWLDIVMSSKEWKVVAIVDINEEILKKSVEKYPSLEGKTYTSLKDCLKKVKADALLNVTPPAFHKETSIIALREGLHVLVEKPLSDTIKNAEKIVEQAEKYGRKLMVSQNYRYNKIPRTIRKMIDNGEIGKISWCILNFQKGPRFGGFRAEMPFPLLIDMSIHHFDLSRYLLGTNPLSVYAESWNPHWSWLKGDACIFLIFDFEKDIRFNYSGSWVSVGKDTQWPGIWEIYGDKGTIIWDNSGIKKVIGGKEENIEPIVLEREDRFLSLYEFYISITENREPETSGKDNLKSLSMVFKSLESIKKGKKVKI
ncbi:MAG: Gfo/Idh/MocA family oxidoreductase [Candidatus Omnitrophica bacterium]|nr:Gfo/Idh/MocA family oxidoreductase [Candidatus Omnitrophota bacterium]MCM8801961.1 Gfo/Idh/MocA family oxidoreductase [Candidatus Omnitrophota bacterium]